MTKKDTIKLGNVEGVNHEAKHLGEALGISMDRVPVIKKMCVEITDREKIRVSEVLCEIATQFKGNELLYALFMLGELRSRCQSSCSPRIVSLDDVGGDIGKILDKLLKDKKD